MLLAFSRSDETNIVACKVAADLFNIPGRIARVRSSEYLEYLSPKLENSENGSLSIFGATETISPEQLVTEQLVYLIDCPGALQVLRFADDRVRMVIIQARRGGLLVGRSIADIAQDLPDGADCQICAVYRNNRLIVPAPQTVIIEGDEILFAAAAENIGAVIPELRPKETSTRRIMIVCGGNIGYRLAKQLEHAYNVKIIECQPRRAEWIAENLDNTLVLQGSATDETLLDNEYIDEIDVFCALTNDDESNIMSALLAKNLGAKRVIGIVNRSSYVDLLEGNKIDIVVSPHLITIGSILAHILARRHRCRPPHPARHGGSHRSRRTRRQKLPPSSAGASAASNGLKAATLPPSSAPEPAKPLWDTIPETVIQDGDHIIFFVSQPAHPGTNWKNSSRSKWAFRINRPIPDILPPSGMEAE